MAFNLKNYGIDVALIHRNTSVPELYEIALRQEKGTAISDVGALLVYSGEKTGRSPKTKELYASQIQRITSTGGLSTSNWTNTFLISTGKEQLIT